MSRLVVIKHIEREGPGLIKQISEKKGLETKIYRPYLNEDLPKLLKGDLLIIMGGPQNVNKINHKNFKFLSKELKLIQTAKANNIPTLGICLGAQLIAHAFGGSVEKLLEHGNKKPLPEIGWGKIKFSNPIGNNHSTENHLDLDVLHWHEDRIILPFNSKIYASSNRCKEQVFQVNDYAFGLQCHLEVTAEMVFTWIKEDKSFIQKSLGKNGKKILYKQQNIYGERSEGERILILTNIIDMLLSKN